MGDGYFPKDRYIKNKKDEVINLKGELGNPTHSTALTITAVAQQITISTGKKTILLTNIGTKDAYVGSTGVTSSNGTPVFSSGESIRFDNVKDDFAVFAVTAAGTSTEFRVLEF